MEKGLAYSSLLDSKGNSLWTPEQWQNFGAQGGTIGADGTLKFGGQNLVTTPNQPGFLDKTMDFLGSDSMKGVGTVAGIGMGLANIFNSMSAQKQAKKQWEAENARANELMAMNREKYNTYKADKARLNSQYA